MVTAVENEAKRMLLLLQKVRAVTRLVGKVNVTLEVQQPPLSAGDTFQGPQWCLNVDNPKCYMYHGFPSPYIPVIEFNL